MTSNKVGHDYPTGPLDMIQSWVELRVTDAGGHVFCSWASVTQETFWRRARSSSRPNPSTNMAI